MPCCVNAHQRHQLRRTTHDVFGQKMEKNAAAFISNPPVELATPG